MSVIRKIKALEYKYIQIRMILNIFYVGFKVYRNPVQSFRVTRKLITTFKKMMGNNKLDKAYKINGKYQWDIFNPAWPSKSFNRFMISHLHEIEYVNNNTSTLRRLFVAITKKCPLNCEHCSEGESLHKPDILTLEQMQTKIDMFVDKGLGQIVYSGGEPLSRFNDLVKMINRYSSRCDQWIYTSGFGLTENKVKQLKNAGLNGIAISLDSHELEKHNSFRNNEKSFQWVEKAIENCKKVGVMYALNLCPTKEFIDGGGLNGYLDWAAQRSIPIINVFEPRPVGFYENKDVTLTEDHQSQLVTWFQKANFSKERYAYPTVIYPSYFRNVMPCGGGRSYMLLDYDGTLKACPFCKTVIKDVSTEESFCEATTLPKSA